MALTDTLAPAEGSISGIAARLAVWGRHAPYGLARVEFDSDFSRQKVVEQLRVLLVEANIPFYEIALPQDTPAADIVTYLKEQFAPLPHSVVSVTGWATAFSPDVPFQESLRVLNYNRENLAQFPLCQVWWTTRSFTDSMVHEIPDLASWFILRLNLTENIAIPILPADKFNRTVVSIEQQDLARRLASAIQERFQRALQAQLPLPDIVQLAIAAGNMLYEAGLDDAASEMSALLIRQIEQLPEYRYLLSGVSSLNDIDKLKVCNSLAALYRVQKQFNLAEAFLKKALHTAEKMTDLMSQDTAIWLKDLASLYEDEGRYQEAGLLYERALAINELAFGPNHPNIGDSVNNLAFLYVLQRRYQEAELLYKRALSIAEQSLGSNHRNTSKALYYLALLYQNQGRYQEAEPLLARAVVIAETEFGMNDPNTKIAKKNYALLLEQMNKAVGKTRMGSSSGRDHLIGDEGDVLAVGGPAGDVDGALTAE